MCIFCNQIFIVMHKIKNVMYYCSSPYLYFLVLFFFVYILSKLLKVFPCATTITDIVYTTLVCERY